MKIIDIPNGAHGPRREPGAIDRIVWHAIGEWVVDGTNVGGKGRGYVWHCTDWLRAIGRSTHAFALPDGRIVREVDSWYAAWHAKGWNMRSVGLEYVLPGVWPYARFIEAMKVGLAAAVYTGQQLRAGATWTAERMAEHEVAFEPESITTHHDCSPKVKWDPGVPFPFEDVRHMALSTALER